MSSSNIEKLRRLLSVPGIILRGGPLSAQNISVSSEMAGIDGWRGITTINSGDASVTVSAAAVASGYYISTGLGRTTVGSHRDLVTSVDSVVDDTSFELVLQNATVDDQEVVYEIIK